MYENRLTIDLCKNYINMYPISRCAKYKTPLCYFRNSLYELLHNST